MSTWHPNEFFSSLYSLWILVKINFGPSSSPHTSLPWNALPSSQYQISLILQGQGQMPPPPGSLPRCLPTILSMANFHRAWNVYKAQCKHLMCMNSLTPYRDPNTWVMNIIPKIYRWGHKWRNNHCSWKNELPFHSNAIMGERAKTCRNEQDQFFLKKWVTMNNIYNAEENHAPVVLLLSL